MSCRLCGLPGAFGMCSDCRENTDNVPDKEDQGEGKKVFLFGEEVVHHVYENSNSLQCADCYSLIFGGEQYYLLYHCDAGKEPDQWFKKERKCSECFQDDLNIHEIELI